jgi:hypothetical protein
MNPHIRLQMLSVITKESDKARNPLFALGIMLRGLRQVDVYCRLGGTVETAVAKFFNGKLLAKLEKAISKGDKNALKAYQKKMGINPKLAAIEAMRWEEYARTNSLPQYQGREIDGDYSSWLVSNNMD